MTVGTGIGAGALVGGRPLHGLVHPEMGHISVPREPGDDFAGVCPFHGDCFEGMASGSAIAARWGRPAEELDDATRARAADLEARYLAAGVRNMVYALAPQRVVIGGGVIGLPGLIPALRTRLAELLGGYPGLPSTPRRTSWWPPGSARTPGPGARWSSPGWPRPGGPEAARRGQRRGGRPSGPARSGCQRQKCSRCCSVRAPGG